MHIIRIRWWMLLSLLFRLIESLDYTDFGLPNNSSCAFSYNNTLYIIGNANNVSISFSNPWDIDPPKVSKQANANNNTPTIACAITRSGKLILLPFSNSNPLQVIDSISTSFSWQLNNNITYQGSQNAINKFITKSLPISNFALVAFKDYLMIQELQTTFILDIRFPTEWTWYELPNTPLAPPLSTANYSLFATSRWILHFRTAIRFSSTGKKIGYTAFIDCFDPLSFTWLGQILSFNTTTNFIQAIWIQNSTATTTNASDSLLLIPSWSLGTQDLNLSETATNNYADAIFWKLDISTWIHTNVTLSPIVIRNIGQSYLGGTVTQLGRDLAVFYGGSLNQKLNVLQFFNTTNFTFTSQPQWLNNNSRIAAPISENNTSKNDLAIILGSVMGSVIFIAILILFIFCCLKKKRSHSRSVHLPQHTDNHKNKCLHWPLLYKSKKSRNPESLSATSRMYEPSKLPYVLSPIQATAPINLFPLSTDQQSTSQSKNEGKLPPMTSRFIEHFDYHAFPLVKNHSVGKSKTCISLGNIAASSSSPPLKIEESTKKQLPRSVSSYV